MENHQEKSQEEMVKEAVEEAKKENRTAQEAAETDGEEEDQTSSDCREETGQEDAAPEDEEEKAEEETPEADDGKKDERRFFGKKNKKDKKDEKIAELTDRLTRQMAEFDNFRKRTDKEKAQMYEIGARDVIEKILPVLDNFERGLAGVAEEDKENPFVQGMEMTYKQFLTTLEGIGVKPIEAVGETFNPDFHNAVMHVEDENLGENVVAEEFQRGYLYRDSVVRHSMVKVAN